MKSTVLLIGDEQKFQGGIFHSWSKHGICVLGILSRLGIPPKREGKIPWNNGFLGLMVFQGEMGAPGARGDKGEKVGMSFFQPDPFKSKFHVLRGSGKGKEVGNPAGTKAPMETRIGTFPPFSPKPSWGFFSQIPAVFSTHLPHSGGNTKFQGRI